MTKEAGGRLSEEALGNDKGQILVQRWTSGPRLRAESGGGKAMSVNLYQVSREPLLGAAIAVSVLSQLSQYRGHPLLFSR